MSTINMTLPKRLQKFVAVQVTELGLVTPEEYIEKLIEEKQKEELWAYYEKEVAKAFESGPPIPMDENFWKGIKEEVRQRREAKKQNVGGRK